MSSFPPLAKLVPQAGPMCLLDRVLEHSAGHTACAVVPDEHGILADPTGSVPVWVGLEYMAQCIAAHGGLVARARGEAPRPGLFLGTRRVHFETQSFDANRELRVTARHHGGERGLVAFDCEVQDGSDGPPLVRGRMNVYIVDSWQELGAVAEHVD